jgi:hypothetical protein
MGPLRASYKNIKSIVQLVGSETAYMDLSVGKLLLYTLNGKNISEDQ